MSTCRPGWPRPAPFHDGQRIALMVQLTNLGAQPATELNLDTAPSSNLSIQTAWVRLLGADGEKPTALSLTNVSCNAWPCVEVRVGRFTKWTLTFTHALEAEIQLVELTLHKGRITQIGKCDCTVSASLKYKDTPLHELMAPRTVPLTRSYKLPGEGLPLF